MLVKVLLLALWMVMLEAAPWWQQCKMLEMSHELSAETLTYPLKSYMENRFKLKRVAKGMYPAPVGKKPVYLHFNAFCMIEHMGTHIDSPNHVLRSMLDGREKDTIDEVDLGSLVGEACVIDVPEKEKFKRSDYRLTVDDVKQWERDNGIFHEDCIVIIRSGQGQYWGNINNYLGSDTPSQIDRESGFPTTLHWPGMSPEAAQWILDNRGMKAIGQDAISFDHGQTTDFYNSVHTVILGSNRPGFENLKNVEKLPKRGATIVAMPLKIKDGSGSPARVFAYGWEKDDPCRVSISDATAVSYSLILFLVPIYLFLA